MSADAPDGQAQGSPWARDALDRSAGPTTPTTTTPWTTTPWTTTRRSTTAPARTAPPTPPTTATTAAPLASALHATLTRVAVPPDLLERVRAVLHRRRQRRWTSLAAALIVVGSALAVADARAYHGPSLATLTATPPTDQGVLGWLPRGADVGNRSSVEAAVRRLQGSDRPARPTTALHLLYAGNGIAVFSGRTSQGRPAVAEVSRTGVTASLLPSRPVALTLPARGGVRFLVGPYDSLAGRATVSVQDPAAAATDGFRILMVDQTGLTPSISLAQRSPRFAVLVPPPGSDLSVSYGTDQLRGDGTLRPGSLVPDVPRIRLAASPWRGFSQSGPSMEWLDDAELIATRLRVRIPVTVASLVTGVGFSVGGGAVPVTSYAPSLYAVGTAGHDYVGVVLHSGKRTVCVGLSRAAGGFQALPVVAGRCFDPMTGSGALVVTVRSGPGATGLSRVDVLVAPANGRPAQRFELPGAGGTALFAEGASSSRGPVTLTAYAADGSTIGTYRVDG